MAGTILSVTMAMEASDLGSQTAPNEELVIFCGAGFTGAMSEIADSMRIAAILRYDSTSMAFPPSGFRSRRVPMPIF